MFFMNLQIDHSKQNSSKAIAHETQRKEISQPGFTFIDNRPEAIAQRKLNAVINSGTVPNIIQLNQEDVDALDQKDEVAGSWNVNQDGLLVNIEHKNKEWSIDPHTLHNTQIGGFDQVFYGGYTLLEDEKGDIVHDYSKATKYKPKIGHHTEKQYVESVEAKILEALKKKEVVGVIIEINQTLSICTACQKYLTTKVNEWKETTGKKVIVRAQARTLYEHQSGQIGKANQKLQHGGGEKEELYPYMDSNSKDGFIGIHNYIKPAY